MVKKKVKNIPVEDSSDTGPACSHLRKAVEEGPVKKALVNVDWTICQDCPTDNKEKDGSEEESVESSPIWLCLKCGNRGCGRYSTHQHALNHYNKPRSVPHCVVLSMETWGVWCYACDVEVPFANTSRLGQLVEYIQRKSKSSVKTLNSVLTEQDVCTSEKVEETIKSRTSENMEEDPNKISKGDKAVNILSNNQEPTVKGLSNLGNTCFFNAVMQNLSQTPTLRELLIEVKLPQSVSVELLDSSLQELNLNQSPGPLTLAMSQFLTEMQETKKGVVTPKEVFTQVCKKAIRFKGYQQQDSQELLRYLLDGMRGEEIQRIRVAMTKELHGTSEKQDEEEIKKKIKDCEKRRAFPNFVDRLFGGELTSTIMCEECHTVSLVHEPFLDLSLPVLDDVLSKKVSPKTSKNLGVKKPQDEEEEDEDDDDSYVKEKSEGTGTSKHLQKKAKKQAKKQAKNQRRQQKFENKTVLFNNLCATQKEDDSGNEESVSDKPESETNPKQDANGHSDNLDTVSREDNANLESDSKGQTEQSAESTVTSEEIVGANSVLCKQKLESNTDIEIGNPENNMDKADMDVGILENNSELGVKVLETSNEISVRNLENGTEMDVGNMENNTESAAFLENGSTGCLNTDTTELQDESSHVQLDGNKPCTEQFDEEDQLTENLNRLNLGPVINPSEIELEIIDEPPEAHVYEVVMEDPKTAFRTLADRLDLPLDECSVLRCLSQFTHKENLTGNNQLLCNVCTRKHASKPKNNVKGDKKFVYTNAKKQMLISDPPPILTLHLKRFQQNGFNLHKINKHIKFPELIDLAPFCTVKCKNIPKGESRLLYSLYGVIEHSGTMRSGHYTAYVKLRNPNSRFYDLVLRSQIPEESNIEPTRGPWYHISDSHVQAVPLSKVLNSQAYLLFYERIL
ncbi:ubiquitin carboxyl-terminal hydrolase 16 [Pelobates fuscus]|uniref:ubiquitin carboxyl-terminal hydrolase 16 n=1 Tax=Pelobates fuscus TaxID=191477 RepID=UPI002FE4EB2E